MSEQEIETILKSFVESGVNEKNEAKSNLFTYAKFTPAVQAIKSNFRRFTDFYVEPSESEAHYNAKVAAAQKNPQQAQQIPDEQTLHNLYEQEVATKW